MNNYRTIDDVEKDAREREAKEFAKGISKGFDEFMEEIIPKRIKRKFNIIKFMVKSFLFLLFLTISLGCIWLLKKLIISLFFGGG